MMRDALEGRLGEVLEPGDTWTLAPGQLAFVLRGFLAATLDGHFDRLMAADGLVGIEQGPETTLRALTQAEILLLDYGDVLSGSESPAVVEAVRAIAEARVRQLVRQRAELERNLDDFLKPGTGGFAAPPYTSSESRLILAVLRDASLAAELPAPLRPLPGVEDRVLLVWSHYPDIGPPDGPQAAYEESALFIPCVDPGGGGPGLYCPALFPESMMAILTGREAFKFPKRFGNVIIEPTTPTWMRATCRPCSTGRTRRTRPTARGSSRSWGPSWARAGRRARPLARRAGSARWACAGSWTPGPRCLSTCATVAARTTPGARTGPWTSWSGSPSTSATRTR